MEEMKWFSSAMLDVLGANNLGFGLALAEICQTTVGQRHQCHRDMVPPKSVTQGLLNIVTTLIGPIWRK
jgi:hypothetical protein